MNFVCPICKGALVLEQKAYKCSRSHSFDIARSGYVNLLPPAGLSCHGDNKEMLAARRRFLDTGHYYPLAKRVCTLASEYIPPSAAVLDIGCGEGYYTDLIERTLSERDGKSRVSALDISKDALKLLCARNKNISCAAASAYSVPAADGAFLGAVNMFSPLAIDEVARLLGEGGIFIMAFPAEDHLFSLKAAIYDTPYKNTPADMALEGFELIHTERVSYTFTLGSADQIASLFMMTPYAYRTKKENRDRILALSKLDCEADFYLCVYKKKGK
jgi:23S rRNA (guanine745-N1)-methyltransferase